MVDEQTVEIHKQAQMIEVQEWSNTEMGAIIIINYIGNLKYR